MFTVKTEIKHGKWLSTN